MNRHVFGLAAVLCSGAGADELVIDLPSAELGIFGLQFVADFLGPVEGTVVDTTAHFEFDTETGFGSFPAESILVELVAPVGEGDPFPEIEVTGADLGWEGAGQFVADFESDALDGEILIGQMDDDAEFSLWQLRLIHADGAFPLGGQFTSSTFVIEIEPACAADVNGDGALDILDFVAFQNLFVDGDDAADFNGDGVLNILDFVAFQGVFVAGCA